MLEKLPNRQTYPSIIMLSAKQMNRQKSKDDSKRVPKKCLAQMASDNVCGKFDVIRSIDSSIRCENANKFKIYSDDDDM